MEIATLARSSGVLAACNVNSDRRGLSIECRLMVKLMMNEATAAPKVVQYTPWKPARSKTLSVLV